MSVSLWRNRFRIYCGDEQFIALVREHHKRSKTLNSNISEDAEALWDSFTRSNSDVPFSATQLAAVLITCPLHFGDLHAASVPAHYSFGGPPLELANDDDLFPLSNLVWDGGCCVGEKSQKVLFCQECRAAQAQTFPSA